MNINISSILTHLEAYDRRIFFDRNYFKYYSEINDPFNWHCMYDSLVRTQKFFIGKFEIIDTRKPENFRDFIEIIYDLSTILFELYEEKSRYDLTDEIEYILLSNYCYYTTIIFLFCYAKKEDQELEDFPTPREVIKELLSEIQYKNITALFN